MASFFRDLTRIFLFAIIFLSSYSYTKAATCSYSSCPSGTYKCGSTCSPYPPESGMVSCCTVVVPTSPPPTTAPKTPTPTPTCCLGGTYCTGKSWTSCKTDSTCNWNSACTVPTPTPTTIPTPTSTPVCCLGPSYCSGKSWFSCKSDSTCLWNSACTAPSPTPSPTPYPTIPPVTSNCSPGETKCINGAVNGVPTAYIQKCSVGTMGPVLSIAKNCPSQVCNKDRTDCDNSIIPLTTPVPKCTNGTTKCEGTSKYICVSGQWDTTTDNSACGGQNCCTGASFCASQSYSICSQDTSCRWTCPAPTIAITPTPTPTGSNAAFYDCVEQFGFAYCTQTNPLWANIQLPNCYNDQGQLISNPDNTWQSACGQAVNCSLLCSCNKNKTYCNVTNCIKSIPRYQDVSCSGTGPDLNVLVLKENASSCYQSDLLTPVIANVSPPEFSKNQLKNALKYGPVEIIGTFTNKTTGAVYVHNSLIVGIDSSGKLIFNDPFFNPQNPILQNQITSKTLEDHFEIKYTGAISIKKK